MTGDEKPTADPVWTPLVRALKVFVQQPAVVRFVSVACFCAVVPFAFIAAFWYATRQPLLMWCNVFWALFLLGASLGVRRLGIQRILAVALLLTALIFLGTAAVWLQLGNHILSAINVFWMVVFLLAAYVINPRRDEHGNPVNGEDTRERQQP
jgi:heme A synthase